MFAPKPLVSEKEDKTPYVTYWPHRIKRIEAPLHSKDHYQVVSIDPGIKNYAIRIEKRYKSGLILPVYYNLWKLAEKTKLDPNEPMLVYANLTQKLDSIKEMLLETDMVIVERQLAINYKSTRVMQHTLTYFHVLLQDLPSYPLIYDIDPKLKGRMLGAPPKISKPELKEWAVVKANELLNLRRDEFSLNVLNKLFKKSDDLADTVCQAEALFMFWGIEPITRPHIIPVETQTESQFVFQQSTQLLPPTSLPTTKANPCFVLTS